MKIKIKWIKRKQMTHENTYRHDTCMMVYYILFIQEIKDIILSSMESSRFRDSRNRSSCKLEKTRTDPAGFKLKERLEFFSASENQTRQLPRLPQW